MNTIKQTATAIRHVLSDRTYRLIFFVSALLFFGLFILIPVVTTPGNTLRLQMASLALKDHLLLLALALLVGLNVSMQFYRVNIQRQRTSISGLQHFSRKKLL